MIPLYINIIWGNLLYIDKHTSIGYNKYMPLYDFKCNKCGVITEYRREFGEDREPICCGISMQRQWSAPSVIFNGPGFYSTDNRK